MLARRFSVVCFILMLFGMWFSSLVADADRRLPASTAQPACAVLDTPLCRTLGRY